ncbi:MAG: DUF488 domain-containing protein [Bacteroidota bacterium]
MTPARLCLVTLGVYGSTEDSFFGALQNNGVDTFVDVRQRRGLRGSKYAYANSTRLQERLAELGIRYVHLKDLAPTPSVRDRQKEADKRTGVAKRDRDRLGDAFVEAYRSEVLEPYDLAAFFEVLPDDTRVAALFCVERAPAACHRSLLAEALREKYDLEVDHVDTATE